MTSLSWRQRQVLQHASEGQTAKETAIILNIAYDTVKNHRDYAMRKLKAKSMTQAVANALREGLIK